MIWSTHPNYSVDFACALSKSRYNQMRSAFVRFHRPRVEYASSAARHPIAHIRSHTYTPNAYAHMPYCFRIRKLRATSVHSALLPSIQIELHGVANASCLFDHKEEIRVKRMIVCTHTTDVVCIHTHTPSKREYVCVFKSSRFWCDVIIKGNVVWRSYGG